MKNSKKLRIIIHLIKASQMNNQKPKNQINLTNSLKIQSTKRTELNENQDQIKKDIEDQNNKAIEEMRKLQRMKADLRKQLMEASNQRDEIQNQLNEAQ